MRNSLVSLRDFGIDLFEFVNNLFFQIVGYPNVGKSSLINSLKRTRAVGVAPTPGFTKTLQEVRLDKQIRLIDSPGVIFSSAEKDPTLLLRNCIRVEELDDPVQAGMSFCFIQQVFFPECPILIMSWICCCCLDQCRCWWVAAVASS
jgi:hypothetical protein